MRNFIQEVLLFSVCRYYFLYGIDSMVGSRLFELKASALPRYALSFLRVRCLHWLKPKDARVVATIRKI